LIALSDLLARNGHAADAVKVLQAQAPAELQTSYVYQMSLARALELALKPEQALEQWRKAYEQLAPKSMGGEGLSEGTPQQSSDEQAGGSSASAAAAMMPVLGRILSLETRLGHPDKAEAEMARLADKSSVPKEEIYGLGGQAFQIEGDFDRAITYY